jgi:hypothetical protein
MKIIAETPNIRLVCDGREHLAEDKRTGSRYTVQKCDCKNGKGQAAEPALSENKR